MYIIIYSYRVYRPSMLYEAETWAVKKDQEKRMKETEMRMLSWMWEITKMDRINNEVIRLKVKIEEISK